MCRVNILQLISQRIDPQIASKIEEFVKEGITNVKNEEIVENYRF